MPTIEISQDCYDRMMALKPLVEQVTEEAMSESEYADFIAFWAVEALFLESALSGDYQVVEYFRRGDSAAQAAINALRNAQITLEGLSRRHPGEVFGFLADVWRNMSTEERRDKGIGLHVLRERYKQAKEKAR